GAGADGEVAEGCGEDAEPGEERRRRRWGGRRRRRGEEAAEQRSEARGSAKRGTTLAEPVDGEQGEASVAGESPGGIQDGARKRRRRGKRGGRRRRQGESAQIEAGPATAAGGGNAPTA